VRIVASRDDRLLPILARVAPGTALREGMDRIMRSGKGAIIVLGAPPQVQAIVSGGFRMDTTFSAQRLSEVAKMDGAIILDAGADRILYANVHLVPDPAIATSETGTRHRTAERTARGTAVPVICISESMRTVHLYVDDTRYALEDSAPLLFRANQALSTLERYRNRLDEVAAALSALEVENVVTLRDAVTVLQRVEMVRRIADEVERSVMELGSDGRLLQLQLTELLAGVEAERRLVVRDYVPDRRRKAPVVLAQLDDIPAEQLLDLSRLAAALGYGPDSGLDQPVAPRGYRLLSRIPRLPDRTVDALVAEFASLPRLMAATLDDLDAVEGIGAARARLVKEGLTRLAESSILEQYA
jgi:diadenylate cyclase